MKPNRKFTVIDDVFAPPITTIGTAGTYGYNSDDIISGNGVPTRGEMKSRNKIPQEYVERIQSNFSPTLATHFRDEPQRQMSMDQAMIQKQQQYYPVQPTVMGSGIAGVPPNMNVADGKMDRVSQMERPPKREPFRHISDSRQTCIETLNHIMNCPMCQKYFECDTKIYNVVIIMLIILFTTIIYFLYREEKGKNRS